jgi:hypothetical protein
VAQAGSAVQRIQKALTEMNIQLGNVLSDLSGVSGMKIIGTILEGERDPWELSRFGSTGDQSYSGGSRQEFGRELARHPPDSAAAAHQTIAKAEPEVARSWSLHHNASSLVNLIFRLLAILSNVPPFGKALNSAPIWRCPF